jgi:poly(A) polymerase
VPRDVIQHLPEVASILALVEAEAARTSARALAVGGYVRDRLLDRPPTNEVDIVVSGGSGPGVAAAVASRLGAREPVVFERFGTAQVIAGEIVLEFVTARAESYASDSRKPEVRPASLEEDAVRRDFTVNALMAGADGEVLDLTGMGLADLDARLLRTPLPARETFLEDPLRAVRAVRFAVTLGFEMHPDIPPAIAASIDRLQQVVSVERVSEELRRLLLSDHPGTGIRRLRETGLLERLMPEVEDMGGVEQTGFHNLDVLAHTLSALDMVAERPLPHLPPADELVLRLGVLTHDIGKPSTRAEDGERVTFLGHPDVGARLAIQMLRSLRFSNEVIEGAAQLVRLHMRPIGYDPGGWSDGAVRRLVRDSGELLPALLELTRVDMKASEYPVAEAEAKLGDLRRRIVEVDAEAVRRARPPLSGRQLMERYGREPGPWIGTVHEALLEAVMDGDIPTTDGEGEAWRYLDAHPELLA